MKKLLFSTIIFIIYMFAVPVFANSGTDNALVCGVCDENIDYSNGFIRSVAERHNVTLPQQIAPFSLFPNEISTHSGAKVMPSEGDVKTVTIILEFPDQNPSDTTAKRNRAQSGIDAVSKHYKEVSYGKMNLSGDVFYYLAKNNYDYYKSGVTLNNSTIINEALQVLAKDVDFSRYDGNDDGYIDGLYIKVANSQNGFENKFSGGYVSYASREIGDKKIAAYAWIPIAANPYVDIHETGHLLGLADHYAASSSSNVLPSGVQDIMSGSYIGTYHNIVEKYLLGWVEPVVISKNNITMQDINIYRQELQNSDGPQAVIIVPDESKLPFTEFYMIEYRKDNKGIYLWHADTTLNIYGRYLNPARCVEIVHASGDGRAFNVSKDLYTTGKVLSTNTYPTSDFYDDVYTGIYMEVLETHDDYTKVRVGFEESDTIPPEIIKTSIANNGTSEFTKFNIDITFNSAFKELNKSTYIKDMSDNSIIPVETSVNGNVLTVKPQRSFERGVAYELVIPNEAIADSSGNLMVEYVLYFNIIPRNEKEYELKQIIEVEEPKSQLEKTFSTADGGWLELSDVNGEWLGYTYPRITKYAQSGVVSWTLDLEGGTEDITVLGFEEGEYSFYAQKDGKTLKCIFYANDEDGEADGQVKANYDTGRYRVPFNDLSLYVNGDNYEIYYTLDGSNPIYEGIKYDGAVEIEKSCTLKAVSVKNGVYSRALEKRYVFTKATIGDMGLNSINYDVDKIILGIKSDGSVITVEAEIYTNYNFPEFTDIVQVAGVDQVLGLKSDGTVVFTLGDPEYYTDEDIFGVSGLTDVIQVEVGSCVFALKADGTVEVIRTPNQVKANRFAAVVSEVSQWHDIVQITVAGGSNIAGLKNDGTIVFMDTNIDWDNIISIASCSNKLFGLTKDGKVMIYEKTPATDGRYDNEWENIVEIFPRENYMLGIDKNGNALSTSLSTSSSITDNGQTDVSGWTDMYKVYISDSDNSNPYGGISLGIKKDGQVVAKGDLLKDSYGRDCDITDILNWNLLVPEQIMFENKEIDVNVGETLRLQPKLKGVNKRSIIWVSSDSSVVKIEQNGTIKALKEGTATITAMSTVDNSVSDICEVTVSILEDISIHSDYSVTNWNVDEYGILSFTITNLTDKPQKPKLMFANYNGDELTNISILPIPLSIGGEQTVNEPIPTGARVLLWDGSDKLRPIVK